MILYLSRKGTLFIGSVEALPRKSSLLPASTHIERENVRARGEAALSRITSSQWELHTTAILSPFATQIETVAASPDFYLFC